MVRGGGDGGDNSLCGFWVLRDGGDGVGDGGDNTSQVLMMLMVMVVIMVCWC